MKRTQATRLFQIVILTHILLLLPALGPVCWLQSAWAQTGTRVHADFNGDGFEDLAVGLPRARVLLLPNAGEVRIFYGSSGGLATVSEQRWTRASLGISRSPDTDDLFGSALAAGDFNRDGFADLAIGVPGADLIGLAVGAGGVHVIYGRAGGLSALGEQFWSQDTFGIEGGAEFKDAFGAALAAGDFNGDSFIDLAIGVPGEDFGSLEDAGAVNILYGTSNGLDAENDQIWTQTTTGVEDEAEVGDRFGASLAAADFNGDGFIDLAIGVPNEGIGDASSAGAVNVLYGAPGLLSATNDQLWVEGVNGLPSTAQSDERFGSALATGDFNGDSFFDLAVGAFGENLSATSNAGAAFVVYGSASRLIGSGTHVLHRNLRLARQPIQGGPANSGDFFARALAAGDFNGDGFHDLAVGVPRDDVAEVILDAGSVNVFYGTSAGFSLFSLSSHQLFHQNVLGLEIDLDDFAESRDQFGEGLSSGDFNGDGFQDLVIGVPLEDSSDNDEGMLHVMYGSSNRLSDAKHQRLSNIPLDLLDDTADEKLGGVLIGSPSPSPVGFGGEWVSVQQTCRQTGRREHCRITGVLEVENPGVLTTVPSVIHFYLSTDATLDEGDVLLERLSLEPLGPGETTQVTFSATPRAAFSAAGRHVIAILDALNAEEELNEQNNIVVSPPIH